MLSQSLINLGIDGIYVCNDSIICDIQKGYSLGTNICGIECSNKENVDIIKNMRSSKVFDDGNIALYDFNTSLMSFLLRVGKTYYHIYLGRLNTYNKNSFISMMGTIERLFKLKENDILYCLGVLECCGFKSDDYNEKGDVLLSYRYTKGDRKSKYNLILGFDGMGLVKIKHYLVMRNDNVNIDNVAVGIGNDLKTKDFIVTLSKSYIPSNLRFINLGYTKQTWKYFYEDLYIGCTGDSYKLILGDNTLIGEIDTNLVSDLGNDFRQYGDIVDNLKIRSDI